MNNDLILGRLARSHHQALLREAAARRQRGLRKATRPGWRWLVRLVLALALLAAGLQPAAPAAAGWHSLTGILPAHTGLDWRISPDSRHVVFTADIEHDGTWELYSVPITGTSRTKLNLPLVDGSAVWGFAITPDSQYVIYTAKHEAGASDADLYRVPIAGGQAVKLNLGPLSGRNVGAFRIDPNNVYVVYLANQQSNNVYNLFSVPIAGGTAATLNPPLVAGGNVFSNFQIDRFANRVVYHADQEVDNRNELYGVPLAGGQAARLNPEGWHVDDFALHPTVSLAVFRARPALNTGLSLYSNHTGGGFFTTLSVPLGAQQRVAGYKLSADGSRVVYNVVTGSTAFQGDVYATLYGGASIPITLPAEPGFGVNMNKLVITADGQRAVYNYRQAPTTGVLLESVSLTGEDRAFLGGSEYWTVSPNGAWVVFGNGFTILSAISITGGTASPLADGTWGSGPTFTPDSSRVIFRHDPSGDVHSVAITGGDLRNLSQLPSHMSAGTRPQVSPDGKWIVYAVYHGPSDNPELRVSDGNEGQADYYSLYLPLVRR
jgi:hypothetical protein